MVETGSQVKKELYRIICLQLMLIAGLALVMCLIQGLKGGLSTVMGGIAYWLPTLFFVYRVLAKKNMRGAKQFVIAFFAGETFKLLLSAVLFVLIVRLLPVNLLPVLIGYVGAIIAFWIAAIVYLSRHEGVSH